MNAVPSINLLKKKGEGIHHIAFAVDDIHAEMQRLKDEGFVLLNEEPKAGADNKWVCFVHPKTTNGVLLFYDAFDYSIHLKRQNFLLQSI